MNRKRILQGIALAAVVAASLLGWRWYSGSHRSGELVLYGNVDIRTVNLSMRVAGKLAFLSVDEGDSVSRGQELGQLDAEPYRNALAQAEANVAAMAAQLSLLQAGYRQEEIAQVQSEVREREVALRYAETFLRRQESLLPSRAVSANDVDNARTSRDQARAALQASRDKLAQYEAGNRVQEVDQARANLMQAEAALDQARLDLTDTVLLSPSDGVILTRAVEPGTMLAAGSTIFTLSLTRPVWVRAYVDEVNLGRAVPGSRVSLGVDGSDKQYQGVIGFVSPTAEFTPKTVQTPQLRTDLVYRLRIIVDDPDDGLRQGMPVTVSFGG